MYVQVLKKVELYRSYVKSLGDLEDGDDVLSCSDNTSMMDTLIGPMNIDMDDYNPKRRKIELKARSRRDEAI